MGTQDGEKNLANEVMLQRIIDRQAIVDLLIAYATALDSRDWRLLEQCFLPDAVADYGEKAGRHEGYPAIEKAVRFFLDGLDSSQHLLGNYVVKIEGDRATTTCYLHAQHYLEETKGGDTYTVGGTYEDEIIRTSNGWKIKHRKLIATWVEGNPDLVEAAQERIS
jgi:3-phenylpropionate/cinnamic acid dioxygenase small subunit